MGHVLPKIDVTTCIDCKKCERVCPALKDNDKETPKKHMLHMRKIGSNMNHQPQEEPRIVWRP